MMIDKKMIVYKESIFSKIKNFFVNLFSKEDKNNNEKIEMVENSNIVKAKENSFAETLKADTSKNDDIKNENILEALNNNEEALNMLSIDRLKKLEKYYSNVIAKNDEKIKRLKSEN